MRAAAAAGREVFGYNRSVEGVQAARRRLRRHDRTHRDADPRRRHRRIDRAGRADAGAAGDACPHQRIGPRCPLTDVTSVKTAVLDEVAAAGLRERFVGGHPMTGTENSGWSAGHASLFTAAPWVVSVDEHVDPVVWSKVMTLALDCGSVVVPARSDEHDAAAAAISHLPHLLAEALAVTAAEVPLAFALAAGSFRDGTRVAGSAPDLVRAMCEANYEPAADGARQDDRPARPRPRLAGLATTRSPNSSRRATPRASATTAFRAPTSSPS